MSNGFAQFKDKVDRQIQIFQQISKCSEGFSEIVDGTKINYERLRVDYPIAILTRATTGNMIIEWKTPKVPLDWKGNELKYCVIAGIDRQDQEFKFDMYVNNIKRFTFFTSNNDSFEINGKDGGKIYFHSLLRDQYDDAFGYFQFDIPREWVIPGESNNIRIVGENASNNAWFMVYPAPDVISYLKEQLNNECYFNLDAKEDKNKHLLTFSASPNFIGKKIDIMVGDKFFSSDFKSINNHAYSDLWIAGEKEDLKKKQFKILLDNQEIINVVGLYNDISSSNIYPKKIISQKSRIIDRQWVLEVEHAFFPIIESALNKISNSNFRNDNIYVINSSHQDIAWMDSPSQCIIDRDQKIITPAIQLLHSDPDYKFDMENILSLREYLDRHPDKYDEIYKLAKEKRLNWGASFTQPYEDLCSGEMLIRQFYFGRKWYMKNFPGCDTRIAWNFDVPARSLQMPQIMHKSGIMTLLISRHEKGFFNWLSPDGSAVLTYSPGHYADAYDNLNNRSFVKFLDFISFSYQQWKENPRVNISDSSLPIFSMSDMSEAKKNENISKWNNLKNIHLSDGKFQAVTLPKIINSTAENIFDKIKFSNLPSITGERPNVWLYIHGPTHHWAISAKREADKYLAPAEIFSTINCLLTNDFSIYPQKLLSDAWESQIYPDHGWGGKNGEITDSLFKAKFEFARDISKDLYTKAVSSIAAKINTSNKKGTPIIIFNNLSWQRTDPIKIKIKFEKAKMKFGFKLKDFSELNIPFQLIAKDTYDDQSLKSVEIVFIAKDIPSIGYKTYYISEDKRPLIMSGKVTTGSRTENKFYKISFGNAGVLELYDKELKKNLLGSNNFQWGELFSLKSVGEDAGEFADVQQPTMEWFDKLSNYKCDWILKESGPVYTMYEMNKKNDHVTVNERIIIYNDIKKIDINLSLIEFDGERWREFRLAFPTDSKTSKIYYEVPFGVVEVGKDEMKGSAGERYVQEVSKVHPRGIQNWIGASNEDYGVTLSSSVSVCDFIDPTDSTSKDKLLQPVLLASRRSCHGEGNWYPQIGDHEYSFSFTSHLPGWENGHRFGIQSNNPLIAILNPKKNDLHDLSESKSFFSLDSKNVYLSTLKKCEDDDDVILRVYDLVGKNSEINALNPFTFKKIASTNMIEEEQQIIPRNENKVNLRINPHSIETYKLFR